MKDHKNEQIFFSYFFYLYILVFNEFLLPFRRVFRIAFLIKICSSNDDTLLHKITVLCTLILFYMVFKPEEELYADRNECHDFFFFFVKLNIVNTMNMTFSLASFCVFFYGSFYFTSIAVFQ